MQRRYNLLVLYFVLFSLLLLGSAYLLFDAKMGFSYNGVLHYYQGDKMLFTSAKSFDGILKIILPHIFAFGLFLMVLLHFGVFTAFRKRPLLRYFIYTLGIAAFIELFSPFFIILGLGFFAYFKLLAFFVLEIGTVLFLWLLFRSVITR